MNPQSTLQNGQLATFTVGQHRLGIAVLDVQEVLRVPALTRVPLAPKVVAGLMNLRGQIVPAIDMRNLLGLGQRNSNETELGVVVRSAQGAVSLHVDEIGDVIVVDESSLEEPPPNVSDGLRRLLRGIEQRRDGLLLVLDTARTLEALSA